MQNPYLELVRNGIEIVSPDSTKFVPFGEEVNVFESPIMLSSGRYSVGRIGAYTYTGEDCLFMYTKSIGRFCSIARRVTAGESEHPTNYLSTSPLFYGRRFWRYDKKVSAFYVNNRNLILEAERIHNEVSQEKRPIIIGNDVWIGEGVFIRRGVNIGDGAIVASRSVVSKDVPPYAIVGGVPAKLIRYRFGEETIQRLMNIQWWNYDIKNLDEVDWTDVDGALSRLEDKLAHGRLTPIAPVEMTWPVKMP